MSAFSGQAEELEECPARPGEMSRVLVEPGEEHFEEGASVLNSESWSLGLAKRIAGDQSDQLQYIAKCGNLATFCWRENGR